MKALKQNKTARSSRRRDRKRGGTSGSETETERNAPVYGKMAAVPLKVFIEIGID